MSKHITILSLFTLIITIVTNMHSMLNNKEFLRKKESYVNSIEANKYNQSVLLPTDVLPQIFNHLACKGTMDYVLGSRDLGLLVSHIPHNNIDKQESLITYYQIKTLFAVKHTCQLFHRLMPLDHIIKFCKTLPNKIKNNTLQRTIPNISTYYDPSLWTCSSVYIPKIKDTHDNNMICLALLKAGADVNITYELIHKKKLSRNHMSVLSQSVNSADPLAYSLVKYALLNGAKADEKDSEGNPLFFYAETKEMVQLFIDNGCDVRVLNRSKDNVLFYIINKEYSADLMNFYIEHKVSPQMGLFNYFIDLIDNYYQSNMADMFVQKLDILLRSIPMLTKKDIIKPLFDRVQGKFSQFYTIHRNKDDINLFKARVTEIFEKYGSLYIVHRKNRPVSKDDFKKQEKTIDLPKTNYYYGIPNEEDAFDDDLQMALQLSMVDKDKGEKAIIELPKKTNYLIQAAQLNDLNTVISILKKGCSNIDEQDEDGNTALIYATMHKNNNIVRHLLDYGPKKDIANDAGLTAFDIAMGNGDDVIADLLLDTEDQIDI